MNLGFIDSRTIGARAFVILGQKIKDKFIHIFDVAKCNLILYTENLIHLFHWINFDFYVIFFRAVIHHYYMVK